MRGAEFDVSALRYHKIVIMTDADVDGAHIRLLLLTFFYRYQRDLLLQGHVFVACPPLYKVNNAAARPSTRASATSKPSKAMKAKGEVYLYDEGALQEYMQALPSAEARAKVSLQRFKGLGEMMPQQLWDTTMDPARRILKRVSIEDAAAADKLFSTLMGDSVGPRKAFISANVENTRLSDLDF